jgi:hypothetical protein
MAKNYGRCLFSAIVCKECPIYRGRHRCITRREEGVLKIAGMKNGGTDWRAGADEFFGEPNDSFRKGIRSYGWEEPGESKP